MNLSLTEVSSRLEELAAATHRSEEELQHEAIHRLYRIHIGCPPREGPDVSTGPFQKLASDRWAEVVLRHVDPKRFELREPFR